MMDCGRFFFIQLYLWFEKPRRSDRLCTRTLPLSRDEIAACMSLILELINWAYE